MVKQTFAVISVALLSSSLAVAAATPATASSATTLVNKITNGQAVVTQSFNAVNGLQGLVIAPKSGQGQSMIAYVDKSGNYLFIGNVIGADGTNYTQQYTQQYIQSKVAQAAYQNASNTAWVADGSDKAPHKMYVIIDPNCIFCHLLYKEVQPYIQNGQLQIRWIPAGFLKATSAGMAAQILYGATPQKQLATFEQNQTGFNQQAEQGGIQPLAQNSKDMAATAAYSKVSANTAFFEKYGFQGTPVLLYKQTNGTPAYYPGYLQGSQLVQVLKTVGSNW